MKRVENSNEKAKAAQAMLHELAKEVAPSALLKAKIPPNTVLKAKPERRILQAPARPLVVAAG
jgi:hypothetical protein